MNFDTLRFRHASVGAQRLTKRLGMTTLLVATLGLVACGGGGGNTAANPSVVASAITNAPPAVQSISTDEATSISVSNTSKGSSTTTMMQVMRTTALDFDSKVTEGASKDTQLKGKLLLNAKSTDGGKNFAITGKLVQRSAMQEDDSGLSADEKAKIEAALSKFYDASKADYEKFRLAVSTLSQTTDELLKVQREAWRAVPANAADALAQYKAIDYKVKIILENFGKEIAKIQEQLTADLKALNTALVAELQVIKPVSGDTKPAVTVTGTLTGEGKISLTFDLGGGTKILGTGQSDAKGKFTGTFTGPAASDKGTWSANSILCNDNCNVPKVPGTKPVGTVTLPPMTPSMPGVTPSMPGMTPTAVVMPSAGPNSCSGRISVNAEIVEVTSATLFRVAVAFSSGSLISGMPFDPTGAKFVNGTAADIKVGRRVQVCSDDVISDVNAPLPPALKASTIIFK